MKNSLFTPMIGYLMLGKTFRNKITPIIVRQCVRHYTKNYILFKPIHFEGSKILSKVLNVQTKNYCTSQPERTNLMNFSVAFTPDPIKAFGILFHWIFTMRRIGDEFNIEDFIENSKFALEIVTRLLSESRFDKLEGLLTSECKAEVERNTLALTPSQRKELAINAKDIYNAFAYEFKLIRDEGREFAQILVVYYEGKNISKVFEKTPMLKLMADYIVKFSVFNCQFIKEITDGSNDQWTINAINVYKAHEEPQLKKIGR